MGVTPWERRVPGSSVRTNQCLTSARAALDASDGAWSIPHDPIWHGDTAEQKQERSHIDSKKLHDILWNIKEIYSYLSEPTNHLMLCCIVGKPDSGLNLHSTILSPSAGRGSDYTNTVLSHKPADLCGTSTDVVTSCQSQFQWGFLVQSLSLVGWWGETRCVSSVFPSSLGLFYLFCHFSDVKFELFFCHLKISINSYNHSNTARKASDLPAETLI